MLRRLTGQRAEQRAERYLRTNGLKIVTRNWRCRHGEIDLVMYDGESLVFVEVRLRTPAGFASGIESVDGFKQRKLAQAASYYLASHPAWQERPCRFDVVDIDGETSRITWVPNAFEV